MDANLSQSWLAQAGRSVGRDGLIIIGLFGITAGAIVTGLYQFVAPPVAALGFVARVLISVGAFFLALPLFIGGASEERWSTGLRVAGLVVGFLLVVFVLI